MKHLSSEIEIEGSQGIEVLRASIFVIIMRDNRKPETKCIVGRYGYI